MIIAVDPVKCKAPWQKSVDSYAKCSDRIRSFEALRDRHFHSTLNLENVKQHCGTFRCSLVRQFLSRGLGSATRV